MAEKMRLSFNTRKSLCVHMNEKAGTEVAELLEYLLNRVEQLERNKVDITPIAPVTSQPQLTIRRAA